MGLSSLGMSAAAEPGWLRDGLGVYRNSGPDADRGNRLDTGAANRPEMSLLDTMTDLH
jgi:hypothetical protein